MSEVQQALSSLYDSLNALLYRLPNSSPNSGWTARTMLRVGELEQEVGNGNVAMVHELHRYAGLVSSVNAANAAAVDSLLDKLDTYLESL